MSSDLSEREVKLMSHAWKCFDDNPKINFDKLAGLGGYTNVKSCQNAWAVIKKKLASMEDNSATGADGDSGTAQTKLKPTPKKRGKKAAEKEDGGGGGDNDGEESPAKKVRAAPKKRGTTPKEKTKNDSDEDVVKTEKSEEDVSS